MNQDASDKEDNVDDVHLTYNSNNMTFNNDYTLGVTTLAAVLVAVATAATVANNKNTTKQRKTHLMISKKCGCSTSCSSTCSMPQSTSKIHASSRRGASKSSILSQRKSLVSSCVCAFSSLIPKSDKEVKRLIVLDTIEKICIGEESNNDKQDDNMLQDIHKTLEEGDHLEAAILTLGNGSYSYIIFVENKPELCLYAELTFGNNIEERSENAWRTLRNRYSTPLGCWDVVEHDKVDGCVMKLLVAEWSNNKKKTPQHKEEKQHTPEEAR